MVPQGVNLLADEHALILVRALVLTRAPDVKAHAAVLRVQTHTAEVKPWRVPIQ